MHIMKEELNESRKHDFDTAWKMILEAFEKEIVELLFPKIYKAIDWNEGAESLDTVLQEIQKEIFDYHSLSSQLFLLASKTSNVYSTVFIGAIFFSQGRE